MKAIEEMQGDKTVKGVSRYLIFGAFVEEAVLHGLDEGESLELCNGALEHMKTDMKLMALSIDSPLSSTDVATRFKAYRFELRKFVKNNGLCDTVMIVLSRMLCAEMASQLSDIVRAKQRVKCCA